ncbi:unnamed protein product [Caenorhabditis sp. 36 PRJEB53466]|nr:unnamed protein product [Caenorhabditis sp. 36 PRJEB53466]
MSQGQSSSCAHTEEPRTEHEKTEREKRREMRNEKKRKLGAEEDEEKDNINLSIKTEDGAVAEEAEKVIPDCLINPANFLDRVESRRICGIEDKLAFQTIVVDDFTKDVIRTYKKKGKWSQEEDARGENALLERYRELLENALTDEKLYYYVIGNELRNEDIAGFRHNQTVEELCQQSFLKPYSVLVSQVNMCAQSNLSSDKDVKAFLLAQFFATAKEAVEIMTFADIQKAKKDKEHSVPTVETARRMGQRAAMIGDYREILDMKGNAAIVAAFQQLKSQKAVNPMLIDNVAENPDLPGNIHLEPYAKIILNAPFDRVQHCLVKISNTNQRSIMIKTWMTVEGRYELEPSSGVLKPNEKILIKLTCLPIDINSEWMNKDKMALKWTYTLNEETDIFNDEFFARYGKVRQITLPIIYNL